MAYGGALDSLSSQQTRVGPSRRFDVDHVQGEEPVLLREEKIARRESRLGLRSIFGRSKASKEPGARLLAIHTPSVASIRSSITDIGHWPQGHRSEANLSPNHQRKQLPTTPGPPGLSQHAHPEQVGSRRQRGATAKASDQARGTLANWTMPPLFKAFPQAVCHNTLPAATLSADAILRLNEKNNAKLRDETNGVEDEDEQAGKENEKRKHRRNMSASAESLDWTTKVFVLVTSGYLLQYAGSGPFDRLPEKILRLGPSSAAFATDAIPGRHWVVHISSMVEADGGSTPESRSLFSKLPFRLDRRSASNMLMVFESADVMEAWITALRTEIEKLGGKKNLSETGKPKTEESSQHIRERPSQRTLIVRDLSRFSRSNGGPARDSDRGPRSSDGSTTLATPDAVRDQSIDGESTTNSVLSQDERQLESLRESSNRLSFISSGQRTIVTSAASSPEGSPTRDSFASNLDTSTARSQEHSNVAVRPRPNASDISNRRQSLQVARPFVDPASSKKTRPRPPSTSVTVFQGDRIMSPVGALPTPNFSVPRSSNRRFSYARPTLAEMDNPPARESLSEASIRSLRAKPPPVLRDTRPLSMVMDQPSPREVPPRPTTGHRASRQASLTSTVDPQRLRSTSRGRGRMCGDTPSRDPSTVSKEIFERRVSRASPSPHRFSGFDAMRAPDNIIPEMVSALSTEESEEAHSTASLPPEEPRADGRKKYRASLLEFGGPRSRSVEASRAAKRASMSSIPSERLHRGHDFHSPLAVPPPQAAPPTIPLPPIPNHASKANLQVDKATKVLLSRRSMPQLAAGPPLAPPPTRALPPIPQ